MSANAASGDVDVAIERLVASGRFSSKSDVIREGVRLIEEREKRLAALDAAIERGIADADAGRVSPAKEVFAELKARYRKMAEDKSAAS